MAAVPHHGAIVCSQHEPGTFLQSADSIPPVPVPQPPNQQPLAPCLHGLNNLRTRSVRLGFNALSPHDLADEEGEEGDEEMVAEEGTGRGVAVASIDVADPMVGGAGSDAI